MDEEEHLVPRQEMESSSHPETELSLRLPNADYVAPSISWVNQFVTVVFKVWFASEFHSWEKDEQNKQVPGGRVVSFLFA